MKKFLCAVSIGLILAANGAYAKKDTKPVEKAEDKSVAAAMGTKVDTKLPVEISADNLEVLQKENKAIFKGNVIAVQGKMRMNADKMVVHYRQKAAGDAPAKPAASPSPAGDMGAVSQIEVIGHVLIVTPEESAEGDVGNYDVDKKFLTLTGDNVILTREQNILRGKSIEYDMATGRSVLTNKTDGAAAKGDNRVRGVFVPKSDKK